MNQNKTYKDKKNKSPIKGDLFL
jgi:hypothetical protein